MCNTSIIDLYADDFTVYESGHDVKMIESHLQSSIDSKMCQVKLLWV